LLLTGHLRATNSVVANNAEQNCQFAGAGALDNGGWNVQFPGNSCGGIPVADPMLDDFYVPAPQSPLQNAGSNAVCLVAPVFARDVYGQQRPRATNCTVGAVEGDIAQLLHHLGIADGQGLPPFGGRVGVCEACRKRTFWLLIAVVFLLIALLLVLWHFLRRRHHAI
jgi:hypothetical protein